MQKMCIAAVFLVREGRERGKTLFCNQIFVLHYHLTIALVKITSILVMKIIEHVTIFHYRMGQQFLSNSDELAVVLASVAAFKIPAYHWENLFWRFYNKYRFPKDRVSMKYLEIVLKVCSYIYLFHAIYSTWKVSFSSVFSYTILSYLQLLCIKQDPQLQLITHCTLKYFHSLNLLTISMNKKDCLQTDSMSSHVQDIIIMDTMHCIRN